MNTSTLSPLHHQVSQACALFERHLASSVKAVHLFGSAVQGGLKPYSDIDLLVTVSAAPSEPVRQALLLDLLNISASPRSSEVWRALEVTIVSYSEVVPWRHPARRELQFGEWLRQDLQSGSFEPAVADIDLAVLLTMARQDSIALVGPDARMLFEPVPEHDLKSALADTLHLWNSPSDWSGDERNIMLALARIWYTSATGKLAPKDVAADWLLKIAPLEHRSVLNEARRGYLGEVEDNLANREEETSAFILHAKSTILDLLKTVKRD